MEENFILTIYIFISLTLSLVFNILFYQMIFRNKKRMIANFFSLLSTLALMLPSNYGLVFALLYDIDSGAEWLIGFPFEMLIFIAPLTWFIPAFGYTLIRMIYIFITKNNEREFLFSIQEKEIAD